MERDRRVGSRDFGDVFIGGSCFIRNGSATETSGHGVTKENHSLDDDPYLMILPLSLQDVFRLSTLSREYCSKKERGRPPISDDPKLLTFTEIIGEWMCWTYIYVVEGVQVTDVSSPTSLETRSMEKSQQPEKGIFCRTLSHIQ
nr:hypothetical protein [Tanacetum cinerariifolium]